MKYAWQVPLAIVYFVMLGAIIVVFTPVGFMLRAMQLAMLRGSDGFDALVDAINP